MSTIPAIVLNNGKTHADTEAFYAKKNGEWAPTTWTQYAALVRKAAAALLAHGAGDKTALLGANRPEWVIFDVATMAIAGVPAGIYVTSSPVEVSYILNHSEAKFVLVENKDQWAKVKKEWDAEKLPHLQKAILVDGESDDVRLIEWETFLSSGDNTEDEKVDEIAAALDENALGTLIYTSGTTGPPKGVMLTHKNMYWTSAASADLCQLDSSDKNLSFLPLSHIAEQMFTIHIPAIRASKVYYCEGVPKNLKEVRPTIFFGVPRVWEKFFTAVNAQLPPELKGNVGALPDANKAGIRAAIGLDNARLAVSGAAPISKKILDFFHALGITIREVYGMSEVTGPTSFNSPDRTKLGTVGPAFPGVEVKIAEDGEVCVKGPNVFAGYYKNEAATTETMKDGWLHSGDLGSFDDEGLRNSPIQLTFSGGKNITPVNIENAIKTHPLIGECVVIGDARHYLTALISLDLEVATKVAEGKGIPVEALLKAPPTLDAIKAHVDEVNKDLAQVETIKVLVIFPTDPKKYEILPRPLDIPNGELTPTMKVKRNVVYKNWLHVIDKMYEESS